jgi:acylphosphatase
MSPCHTLFLAWLFVAGTQEAAAMTDDAPEPKDKSVARLVHYSGQVQGVGFRATAAGLARDHPVTGYVKNLKDGRVELLAEGTPEAVQKFLEAVRTRMKYYIDKEQIEEQPATGKYKRFEIAR